MPPKRSALKKRIRKVKPTEQEASPTSSEQEILDAVPDGLSRPLKRPEAVSNAYLVYIVLSTDLHRPPRVLIRKSYESQSEAFEAFAREYRVWTTGNFKTGLFPACHPDSQFETAQLINKLDHSRSQSEGPSKSDMPLKVDIGGKVEFSLVHRDDTDLEDHNPRKRRCTIVCEQTTYETAQ